jgi:CheY-like chemotaxis protein
MQHLVLADDSTTTQKVIQLSFAEEEFEVHVFTNGTGALEYVRSYGSDIVLADISLPHLDGYDLCREIRQDPRTAKLPVVLLAGTFEPFDAERALEVGYTSLLVKPFETGQLVDLVKKLVARAVAAKEPMPPREVEENRLKADGGDAQGQGVVKVDRQLPIEVPVPNVSGEILFALSPEQCKPERTETQSVSIASELSSEQVDVLVERLIERLPETLRSLVPEVAKEMLDPSVPDSN